MTPDYLDDDKQAPPGDDAALIAEATKFLSLCSTTDSDNRAQALDDLQFLQGDGQWPENIRALRKAESRPCLTINTLPAMLHQVTNDLRQNKPGIKVHPVDDDADVETAEVMQGMIRHIEYDSNAEVAYVTAASSAAASGAGYFEIYTDYESDTSFDQVIKFRRIRNQFTVYMGYHVEPDGSDMRQCVISEDVPKAQFRQEYPEADLTTQGIGSGIGDTATGWMTDEMVRVARYFRVECKEATLIRLPDGTVMYEDELDAGTKDLLKLSGIKPEKRKSERRKVCVYKITANEVLERTEIPCNWIPVFPVYGDELDINGKVYRSGLIRHAKDPARMYNFWMTSATEEVSLRPKTPYIGAEGQFENHEDEWGTANNRSFSYLEYKPVDLNGNLAPPPQRQPMADVPSGVLAMAAHARDNIKATMGLFDASIGARGSATSGKQELAQQREGDTAQYHYADNLKITMRHAGRCLLWMIPRIYDTPRAVRILGEDETPEHVMVNQQYQKGQPDPETGAVETAMHDLSVGKYDVTITTGPSYTTLRQEAAEAMISFGQSWPKLMDIAGDKVVQAMDWPGAEGIAARIKRTIPAEILGDEDGESQNMVQTPQGPVPAEQAGAMMAQMDEHMKMMSQELQDAQSGIQQVQLKGQMDLQKAQEDNAAKIEIVRLQNEGKQDVEELKGMIQLLIQKMQPPPVLAGEVGSDMQKDNQQGE